MNYFNGQVYIVYLPQLTLSKKIKGETIIYRSLADRLFNISVHSVKRIKERYGETYIGGKKLKNMGINQLRSIILNQVKYNLVSCKEINKTSVYAKTDRFSFVISLGNKNEIVTTLPKNNCYETIGSSLNYSLGGLEALRELRKAM